MSKKADNWNNMIFGVESSKSESNMMIINQDFTSISLIFIAMPYQVWLLIEVSSLFWSYIFDFSSPYALNFLLSILQGWQNIYV